MEGAERTAKLRMNYVYRVLRSGPEMVFQVLLKGRSPGARGEQGTGDVT